MHWKLTLYQLAQFSHKARWEEAPIYAVEFETHDDNLGGQNETIINYTEIFG